MDREEDTLAARAAGGFVSLALRVAWCTGGTIDYRPVPGQMRYCDAKFVCKIGSRNPYLWTWCSYECASLVLRRHQSYPASVTTDP
jgi:hypothetical protein